MRVCECGHASSFHRSAGKKKSGLVAFADGLSNVTGGQTSSSPVADCNKKNCGCLRFTEVQDE